MPRVGGVRHFHLDHLGTPRLVTNGTGQRTAYHVYYPFGEEATAFNQDAERMKFTGHERDLASLAGAGDDLDYMHARHCSPLTGRFLSVDPAGESFEPRSPQSWNRYSYVQNKAMSFLDPTGEFLRFSGTELEKDTVEAIANDGLFGYHLVIDSFGNATLQPTDEMGPPTPGQQALASVLSAAIGRSEEIQIGITTGASDVRIGQYVTGRIDIQDISAIGSGPALSRTSALAHEVMEQTAKQIFKLSWTDYDIAHGFGIAAQDAVSGFSRGQSDSSGFDLRAGTGKVVTTHTRGTQTVTVTLYWVRGNLVRVAQD